MNASRFIVSITTGERRMRSLVLIRMTLLLIGALISTEARAESPSVTAVLTSSETALGQPVQLEVKIKGTTTATPPQTIAVDGLQIALTDTRRSFEMHGFSSVESNLFYGYTIMPIKAGIFKIPPQPIRAGNMTLHTPELTLHVTDAPNRGITRGNQGATPNAIAGEDKLAFAELVVPKKTAYVGEIIPMILRIGFNSRTKVLGREPPNIGGQGFTIQKLGQEDRNLETIGGRSYLVYSYKSAVSAARTGNFQLGPIETKAVILAPRRGSGVRRTPFDPFDGDDPFADPFFSDPFSMLGERREITVKSDTIPLEVKPLPGGAPPTFTGAVGNFSLTADANPKRVQVGDPITVKVEVAGRGNFDRVSAPDLTDESGWHKYPPSSNFKQDDDVGISGTKTFEMVVSPNEKKSALPPVAFSYFDPVKDKYVTLETQAVPLVVEGSGPVVPAVAAATAKAPTATNSQGATSPQPPQLLPLLKERGKIVHSFAPLYAQKEFWIAQLVPLAIAIGLAGWRIQKVRRSNLAAMRAARFQRETDELLRKLRRDVLPPPEYFSDASRVVQLKTALKQNIEPGTVDADTAARVFALDEERSERMRRLFATSDELRYSGKANGSVSPDHRREALELIESLRT
ncbi:MAG: hypothetical protein DMF03_03370 [Verrucomicrobia bacterium]|nr:MAG: hypothetical protein DMF03_03370 [Verrucomicrobiota bacterium]